MIAAILVVVVVLIVEHKTSKTLVGSAVDLGNLLISKIRRK